MSQPPLKPVPIHERLAEFYRRLGELPQADDADAALLQLCETLDQVEDEMSGVAKQNPVPPVSSPDGRMYCPSEDHIIRAEDGRLTAVTRGHRIEISATGRERIVNKRTQAVEFER